MWRKLPNQGAILRELRVESTGKGSEVVIVPASGERIRFHASGGVDVETVGCIRVRSSTGDDTAVHVTFSAEVLELARAEVSFEGGEPEWEDMWRRARTRSRPWWRDSGSDEVDLDWSMEVRITLIARSTAR